MLTILDLCSGSGAWSFPYQCAGYSVVRMDLPDDVRLAEWGDALSVHGILAAPPCTVFASSGARWPRSEEDMLHGLSIVDACLRMVAIYQPRWWVLENPVGTLRRWLGPPRMSFNPCDYGDPYTKKTLLWGDFQAPFKIDRVEPTEGSKMHTGFGGKSDRTRSARSITPPAFARAFYEANP